MAERLTSLSPGWAYLSLLALVFARVQAVYWASRLAGRGARSRLWVRRWEGPRLRRAEQLLNRYGAPAITVSLVTPGLQTVLNALAGVSRMPFGRYLAAMVVGCAAWALIYTVGLVAVWTWIAYAVRSPLGGIATGAAVAATVTAVLVIRGRRRGRQPQTRA